MDIRPIGNVSSDSGQPFKKQGVTLSSQASSKDRIEISDSARAAQEAAALAKIAKAESDVRPEKVEEVRRALAEGVLLSPEATTRLAERLADIL